jgi:hypothetical protein
MWFDDIEYIPMVEHFPMNMNQKNPWDLTINMWFEMPIHLTKNSPMVEIISINMQMGAFVSFVNNAKIKPQVNQQCDNVQ